MSERTLNESVFQCKDMISQIYEDKTLKTNILEVANVIKSAIKKGNKVLFFGNGGSAADAQHMAGEFVCRFMLNRQALPGIALTTDSSVITAIANDYDFKSIFSRQIEGISQKGDIAFAISTSGSSENILVALEKSKDLGLTTIGLSGQTGGSMAAYCDYMILVPSISTPRIQEGHLLIEHIICGIVEELLYGNGPIH